MASVKKESLAQLVVAALENAKCLIEEAELLLDKQNFARAYFLGVAALEETGKAIIAFEGQGRNLSDSAVEKKLLKTLNDHKSKIISAFVGSLKTTDPAKMEEAIEAATGLMTDIRNGREPSMYTELLTDGNVQSPNNVVRKIAATDVIRLAKHCWLRAEKYLSSSTPAMRSRSDDFVYAMKSSTHKAILNSSDFWYYHIEQIKQGSAELSDSVELYYKLYYLKSLAFKEQSVAT